VTLQVLVNLRNAHGAFSDSGRHAFHRARAYVADREDAGQAGFERKRRAVDAGW
jgi:hypothetical protein